MATLRTEKGFKNLLFWFFLFLIPFSLLLVFQTQTPEEKGPPPSFSLVVLPDTQLYSRDYPAIFARQTSWIVDNREAHQIAFVSHTGDIVQSGDAEKEWQSAQRAVRLLDGVVPYGLAIGNHDSRSSFNEFFPFSRYEKESWWGGHFGKGGENNYQLFSAQGLDFIVLHLEFEPDEAVLTWADEVLENHQNRRAIVSTHYFLDYDGLRSPTGEEVFEKFKDNPNLFLILSGHIHAEAKRADLVDGRPIHQLLADYQTRANGGNGWLRILKFVPKEDKIYVQTYSPYLGQNEPDSNSQFELDYEM
jgi:hypothetical protein